MNMDLPASFFTIFSAPELNAGHKGFDKLTHQVYIFVVQYLFKLVHVFFDQLVFEFGFRKFYCGQKLSVVFQSSFDVSFLRSNLLILPGGNGKDERRWQQTRNSFD